MELNESTVLYKVQSLIHTLLSYGTVKDSDP